MSEHLELPVQARCAQCGYSLHGLRENRCPECGQTFDRESILAILRGEHVKLPFDQRAARWLGPPAWWLTAIAVTPWVVVWFPLSSLVVFPPPREWTVGMTCAAYLCCFTVAAFWLKLSDRRRAMRDYVLDDSQKRLRGRNWGVLSVLCILDLTMLFGLNSAAADIRFRVPFRLSEPAMNRLAMRTLAAHAGQPDQQVGCFDATWIDCWPDGMSFRVVGPDDARFFYSTSGKVPTYLPKATRLDLHWFWYNGN